MNYNQFLGKVKYDKQRIFIPILKQWVLKESFMKKGKYIKSLELKFLKNVYNKRHIRYEREERENFPLQQSPFGSEDKEE